MGLNQEKSRGQKFRDTLALKEECQEIFDPFLLYSTVPKSIVNRPERFHNIFPNRKGIRE